MLTRRDFGRAVGATALATGLRPMAARAEVPVMHFGNAAGINDAQLSFITVGKHPKLNYYGVEGVDADVVNMSSGAQTLQALSTDRVEFATLSPVNYLPLYAKTPSLNIVCAYVFIQQNHLLVGVKPDSSIQTIADLKGKTIGIRNPGDTGYLGLQSMFREIGIDPGRDVEWLSVGGGGPAGQALSGGRIEAIAIWDAELARVELAGFKLRYLPNTPGAQHLFGTTFGVSRSGLAANRQKYVGVFRGIAKSTVFAAANPEMAIRIHWQLYPESKPKGKSEEEALREALFVINVRKDKWFAGPWQADKRMGASSLEVWQEQVRFIGLQDKEVPEHIKDAAPLFTNDLIDEVNQFDRGAVERAAKTFTL
jgi:NitT/TauT family transport system substrate-binding protein